MPGIYDSTGGIATTVVTGSSWTGLYASDGSINIVLDDPTYKGIYHPCGALRVNSSTGSSVYDSTGAYYSNHILGAPLGRGGLSPPPIGFSYLIGADSAYLKGADGAYLLGTA